MDYLGPKPANPNRMAVYSELGGAAAFGLSYISSSDLILNDGFGFITPSEYEIGSGFVLELANSAIMEIT